MSDDGHFEFCDLWENGATYSLAYGRNGFSTKKSYKTNRWSTFPQKCLQVFIRGYISIICPDYLYSGGFVDATYVNRRGQMAQQKREWVFREKLSRSELCLWFRRGWVAVE